MRTPWARTPSRVCGSGGRRRERDGSSEARRRGEHVGAAVRDGATHLGASAAQRVVDGYGLCVSVPRGRTRSVSLRADVEPAHGGAVADGARGRAGRTHAPPDAPTIDHTTGRPRACRRPRVAALRVVHRRRHRQRAGVLAVIPRWCLRHPRARAHAHWSRASRTAHGCAARVPSAPPPCVAAPQGAAACSAAAAAADSLCRISFVALHISCADRPSSQSSYGIFTSPVKPYTRAEKQLPVEDALDAGWRWRPGVLPRFVADRPIRPLA